MSREEGLASNLCLTAVEDYTLRMQPCTSSEEDSTGQLWSLDQSTGQLSLSKGGLCLWLPTPPSVSLYAKPLTGPPGRGQPMGLAVLNRQATGVEGQVIDLGLLGLAHAQSVTVRDIWAGTTSPPVSGNFTTRSIDSHETLLLVITPVN